MLEQARRIDVHNHIISKEYVKLLAEKGIGSSLGINFPDWEVNKTLELMDENGIATAITSVGAPGVYFKNVAGPLEFARHLARRSNEISADLVRMHPDRFGAYATLPLPDREGALKELEYALDVLKMDGVWLLSSYEGRYLGDPYNNDLLFELNRRKAVVFIHPTVPPGLDSEGFKIPPAVMDVPLDTTRTAYSLILEGGLEKYPDIKFILSHAGGTTPYLACRVELVFNMLPHLKENLKHNLDYYLNKFYYDTALSASTASFKCLNEIVDTSHIVFGSDHPYVAPIVVALTVKGVQEYKGFDEKALRAIERENALELFPRLK